MDFYFYTKYVAGMASPKCLPMQQDVSTPPAVILEGVFISLYVSHL